jgi:voltage-gated potassium channel
VPSIAVRWHGELMDLEWFFTILFTVEYLLRIVCAKSALRYVFSFFGLIDLLSILPVYFTLVGFGTRSGVVLRSLRLLRMFRIFKMGNLSREGYALARAVVASRDKIVVFLLVVLIAVVIVGAAMFVIEGPEHGFTSIPEGMYWAVVTMTTVGYGDIAPTTLLGKLLASVMMVLGYSLIVVPTGIVTSEAVRSTRAVTRLCPRCARDGHDGDAVHCKFCGAVL